MQRYVNRARSKAEKLSNAQILSLFESVSEENDVLQSILQSLSTALFILDKDFHVLRNNKAAESSLPFSTHLDDAKNSGHPFWEFIDDKDIASYFKNCREKNITNSTEDFTFVTSGGTVRFVSITMMPLVLDNEIKGHVVTVSDVTEKQNQQVRLRRMENLASLTNLAAGMAHEIKNPLGAISIHIQLIQRALEKARENEDKLPAKKFVEDHIDVVNEEIEHLNTLVMDFLLAVRPVNASLELKNPHDVISNVCSFFEPEFSKSGVEIKSIFSDNSKNVRILIDEKLFREVLVNFAQNSLAAIKSVDRKQGIFAISTKVDELKYILRITDNGCGMDEQTVSKIFEPYFTTKANGTGLGMTTVYKIVKEFSGEIQVKSVLGEGTEFVLVFPIPQKGTKLLK